jgi:hypothetical protein
MRDLRAFDAFRDTSPEAIRFFSGTVGDGSRGRFLMRGPYGTVLAVIATTDGDWDHVSVSTPYRCPIWEEMEWVKRQFFGEHETAMQLHVPPADHINRHPYCLHMWRPQHRAIPRPPREMV